MPATRRASKQRALRAASQLAACPVQLNLELAVAVGNTSSCPLVAEHSERSASDAESVSNAVHVQPGRLVWAKISGSPSWPGLAVRAYSIGLAESSNHRWVFWFGDHRVSKVKEISCKDFKEWFVAAFDPTNKKAVYVKAITEACSVAAARDGHGDKPSTPSAFSTWAAEGFTPPVGPHFPQQSYVPDWVHAILTGYQRKNLLARRDVSSGDESADVNDAPYNRQEKVESLEGICIACRFPLKDSVESVEHPLFQAQVCPPCKVLLKENMYAQDPSFPDLFLYCSVCGKPGSRALACKSGDCGRVFCVSCLDCLAAPAARCFIDETSDWQCFVCAEFQPQINRLLKAHSCWQQQVMKFFAPFSFCRRVPKVPREKKGIRVLSLFDGIASALVALDALNISVSGYISAETDVESVRLVAHRHGDRVVAVGDVRDISAAVLSDFGPLDIVLGGSPCTDLSVVNPRRRGIYDCLGTGAMFFEFYRILQDVRAAGNENVFWLFENVAAMEAATKDYLQASCLKQQPQSIHVETTNKFLKCEPFLVDAKNFSAQNRARLFWGNIPGMDSASQFMPKVTPALAEALAVGCGREPAPGLRKLRTVTTSANSLRQGQERQLPVTMAGRPDDVWVTELEAVFGFPASYTDLGNLGLRRRQQMLGRAWSVPVIKHLLAPLRDFFRCEKPALAKLK